MERAKCAVSTVCYLMKDDETLFIQFNKKWGHVFAPPGGKMIDGESPLECIIREFEEETGLILENVKLKGYSYWNWLDEQYGIIFIYTASEYTGTLKESAEGTLEWIKNKDVSLLNQFDMNSKFTDLIFQDGMFEGNFNLDKENKVKSYKIVKL